MPMLSNLRWEKFCQAYVRGETAGNGEASYLVAGYGSTNVNSAHVKAYALLKRPEVKQRVTEIRQEVMRDNIEATQDTMARLGVSPEAVLAEMARIAFANILDYVRVNEAGVPIANFARINRDQAAGIAEITIDTSTRGRGEATERVRRVRIKLGDKRGALGDLGRHFGLFVAVKGAEPPVDPAAEAEIERRIAETVREIAEKRIARAAVSFVTPPAPAN